MNLCTCLNCRRVSVIYTKEQAQAEVDSFNAYFDTLSPEAQQANYGGRRSSLDSYRCCKKPRLREYREGDCPDGVTVSPVVWEGE